MARQVSSGGWQETPIEHPKATQILGGALAFLVVLLNIASLLFVAVIEGGVCDCPADSLPSLLTQCQALEGPFPQEQSQYFQAGATQHFRSITLGREPALQVAPVPVNYAGEGHLTGLGQAPGRRRAGDGPAAL